MSKFDELRYSLLELIDIRYGSIYQFSVRSQISHATLLRYLRDGQNISLENLLLICDELKKDIQLIERK